MKSIVLFAALLAPPILLAAPAPVQQVAPTSPATASPPQPALALPLCLFDEANDPLCDYTPNPGTKSLAGPHAKGASQARYSAVFDNGFNSRTRTMQNCLSARPVQPSQAYRYVPLKHWESGLFMNSKKPYFLAAQPTQTIKQRSYVAYLYCMTHDGFD